jgi:hypothetical protein
MITFDGLTYDFQAVGDFVAVQSASAGNPWQVQIRTDSFPGATSVTTSLAAALGDDRVSFAVGRTDTVYVDGTPDTTLQVGAAQDFAGGRLAELGAGIYQLAWNTGERVTVTDQGGYLDWTVGLGPHDGPGSVRGLLGSNRGPATDFSADAWRVAPGASLLDETTGSATAFSQAMASELVPTGVDSHDPGMTSQDTTSQSAATFMASSKPHSSFDA